MPLGVLPAGTGNDLCRGLGLPLGVRDAVVAVTQGRPRRVDLAQVTKPDGTTRWVGCVVSSGFDSRVALRAAALRVPYSVRWPTRSARWPNCAPSAVALPAEG